jgi:membrane-associated phospholipid phosphatase
MRPAELINMIYFSYLVVMAWVRPLSAGKRLKATIIGLAAISLFWSIRFIGQSLASLPSSIIRDWIPAPLFLVAYWTAGLYFTAPSEKLQSRLMRFDRRVLGRIHPAGIPRIAAACLELAYLLCYPLLPLGLGALYIARMGRCADAFWTVVLPAVYLCFAALPFARTLPPRILAEAGEPVLPPTKIREFNLWILRYGSIRVNTFPSAHVATAFSVSLVLLYLLPLAGIVFLGVSVCIAIAVVLGRYHYAADALIGAAIAMAIFLIFLMLG